MHDPGGWGPTGDAAGGAAVGGGWPVCYPMVIVDRYSIWMNDRLNR